MGRYGITWNCFCTTCTAVTFITTRLLWLKKSVKFSDNKLFLKGLQCFSLFSIFQEKPKKTVPLKNILPKHGWFTLLSKMVRIWQNNATETLIFSVLLQSSVKNKDTDKSPLWPVFVILIQNRLQNFVLITFLCTFLESF